MTLFSEHRSGPVRLTKNADKTAIISELYLGTSSTRRFFALPGSAVLGATGAR
jgi:hypothetical protein